MRVINEAANDVTYTIPPTTLNVAFGEKNRYGINMEKTIRDTVIIPRVMRGINAVATDILEINFNKCEILERSINYMVFKVPDNLLGGRYIIEPVSLRISPRSSDVRYDDTNTGNAFDDSVDRLHREVTGLDVKIYTSMKISGSNVITVDGFGLYKNAFMNGVLKVSASVSLDELSPTIKPTFNKLVKLAVQSYIYNFTIESLDRGFIENGYEVPAVKNIIEGYSSAEEDYMEFLTTKWPALKRSSDETFMDAYIGDMVTYLS